LASTSGPPTLAESSTSRLFEQSGECVHGGQKLINDVDEVMLTVGGSEIGGTRFLNGRLTAFVTQEKNRRTGFRRSFVFS
jgi:hypothetical protein